jgi:hypothetical protein
MTNETMTKIVKLELVEKINLTEKFFEPDDDDIYHNHDDLLNSDSVLSVVYNNCENINATGFQISTCVHDLVFDDHNKICGINLDKVQSEIFFPVAVAIKEYGGINDYYSDGMLCMTEINNIQIQTITNGQLQKYSGNKNTIDFAKCKINENYVVDIIFCIRSYKEAPARIQISVLAIRFDYDQIVKSDMCFDACTKFDNKKSLQINV